MEKVTRPDAKITLRRAALIALPVFIAVLIWAINARVAPVDANSGNPPKGKLPLWIAIIASGFIALMVGAVVSLIISNFRRWRVVLHPNLGRIIGAIILWVLMPILVFSYVPWLLGALFFMLMLPASPLAALIGLLGVLPWYLVSCLLVSGVSHRLLRVALFALVWWGAYSISLLYFGFQIFTL